ncbi:hypothetical protein BDEG_28564 [Batrachochytrium dendrobatidis JEL423]|uniref:Uncharacterized protein n=1 Tax=Batrachochytrium dendrobatidis (strain JEL423) TaxID=403673 RepID=A0A177X0E5_BATDL|nr:hypothetical protein BDEG_28564 [Batrachochytrium dendrobatidis JEL423]
MTQEYGVHDIANQSYDNPDQTEFIGLTLATRNDISGQATSSKYRSSGRIEQDT